MIESPYNDLRNTLRLRGNLHAHTTRSDGRRSPQEVINDYAGRGYGFLMISDHDQLTTAADIAGWEAGGLCLLQGNEITANGVHLLHVGASRRIEPAADRQKVLDAIRADTGFAILNHPNWKKEYNHCSIETMKQWSGYAGIEIYNGTIGRTHGSPYATQKWDQLLSEGRLVWGFANDDSHFPQEDVGLGWNCVFARDPSSEEILKALQAGRFYASTGVDIDWIEVEGETIRIETRNARRIVALRETGRRFAVADGPQLTLTYPEDATYVRIECWGDGEQFAWTQAFHNGRLKVV